MWFQQWQAQSPEALAGCLLRWYTHAACNAWLHSAGESFLARLLFRLPPYKAENPRCSGEKRGKEKRKKTKRPSRPAPSDTLLSGCAPTHIPHGNSPVNLDGSHPLSAPASARTSPPSVQQCPLPPATAFPHSQRFTAEPRRKQPSPPRCFTSAHLLWHPRARGEERAPPGGQRRYEHHTVTGLSFASSIKL